MTPEQALNRIRDLTREGLSPHPLMGAWQALLHIRDALGSLDGAVLLDAEEAHHLAAIVPVVGSAAVDIEELDWFEEHGAELTSKLER